MNENVERIRKSANWGGGIQKFKLLMVLTLLLGLTPTPITATSTARVQPLLLELAAQQPDQVVSVIVQKTVKDDRVEEAAGALGGTITKDLHIINAFVTQLKAQDVTQLAKADGVRWVSLDAPVENTAGGGGSSSGNTNSYLSTLGVQSVWTKGLTGQGIGVAVIDSGISADKDFTSLKQLKSFNPDSMTMQDVYGHGTHVAGIIAGNGTDSGGVYGGIAPGVNLLSLKICDELGRAYESDTVAALQWVLNNKATYNIRVVNLSINSTVEQSYGTSPLNAAAEILWFNGIVIVASVGNKGSDGTFNPANASPANDPFIITVGASDEKGTSSLKDDITAPYSAYGTTMDGFVKPDIVAPGTSIYSVLSKSSPWCLLHYDRAVLNCEYFRLSGTSMAAPMVTGAIALLLQDEPNLTPDQVKYRLKYASNTIAGSSADINPSTGKVRTYPYLNVYKAVTSTTTRSANTGITASQLLWTGPNPVNWGSVQWGSVQWGSVQWGSVQWGSVQWGSVQWGSDYWGP